MQNNFILKTDSYKASHYAQYPSGTTKVYSYLESRGGRFPATVFFGLQYILMKHFAGQQVTTDKIEEANAFFNKHFGQAQSFNLPGWMYIANVLHGKLPLRIRAVREGSLVPTNNVLLTIENTDPKCYWLTNYAETLLMQVWYPITVATHSFECKKLIRRFMKETADDNLLSGTDYKLHDFGYRGVSSDETAGIGGAAHLVNFLGTDTIAGILLAQQFYNADVCGYSIPASEHSTITSWGKKFEAEAYSNMLRAYPEGLVACVSDSYDIYNAAEKIWGETLRDDVMKRNGTLVIRPDSGDPIEVNSKLIDILWNKFGGTYNRKGYKVLDNHVRIIQGDGVDLQSIEAILQMYKNRGFSAENIAFGSGGALLQKFDRDTQKFAIKCSYAEINGEERLVWKDPVTSSGKVSKKGRLKLHYSGGKYSTLTSADQTPAMFGGYVDSLHTVFENGVMMNTTNFAEVRENARKELLKFSPNTETISE